MILSSTARAQVMSMFQQGSFILLLTGAILLNTCLVVWLVRRFARTGRALRDSLAREKESSRNLEKTLEELNVAGERLRSALAKEQAVEQELRRSNEELQQFAFVISHDLQEPLRVIASLAELLQSEHRKRLDEEGRRSLDHILDAGARMRSMIGDLLGYARLGHEKRTPNGLVSMEQVAAWTMSNLEATVRATGASITHDPLPTVAGDFGRLSQVWQNLISNSLKYRGPDPPRIHISAQCQEEIWLFSIKDNGIGIDPRYAERIFGVFKRLHGREYPGTGIGLAICRRIVENLGGRIWVESEPGQGATFYFTLPDANVPAAAAATSAG